MFKFSFCAVLGVEINDGGTQEGEFKGYSGSFFLIFQYSSNHWSADKKEKRIQMVHKNDKN